MSDWHRESRKLAGVTASPAPSAEDVVARAFDAASGRRRAPAPPAPPPAGCVTADAARGVHKRSAR